MIECVPIYIPFMGHVVYHTRIIYYVMPTACVMMQLNYMKPMPKPHVLGMALTEPCLVNIYVLVFE